MYEKAIDIYEKVFGPNDKEVTETLSNLGAIYLNLADYEKAEAYTRRALEIKEKTLPPNSSTIAFSLSNLAAIYSAKRDERKALELSNQAVDVWKKSLPPGHPDLARGLIKVGTSYVRLGDFSQAETNYMQALDILQKAYGPENYRIAVVLGYIADMYHTAHDDAKAAPFYRKNVDMMAKTIGKDHPDYATALFNLAAFYTGKGEYQAAEPLYEESFSTTEKLLGKLHPNLITILEGEAKNFSAEGDTAKALDRWSQAHKIREYCLQSILFSDSEQQKLIYLNSLYAETNQLISAHVKLAPDNPQALELALTTIFERKGRVLDAMASEFAALRNNLNKEDQELFDKYRETTGKLAELILNGAQSKPPDVYQKQVKTLEDQKENLEAQISRKSAEFRNQIQPISVSSIQNLVPEDGVLIEFSVYRSYDARGMADDKEYGEPHYVAYIIPKQGNIRWKDLGDANQINEEIDKWRDALRDPKRNDVQQLGRKMDELIMKPLRSLIGNAKRILVSPDGFLNLIPFEALVDNQGHYQVENYSFTYLTSGRDLLRMQTPRESKNKPLIIANPLFGEPNNNSTITDKSKSIVTSRNLDGTYFSPLSGTAEEARMIQGIFPEAKTLTGAQATKAALRQTIAPQILHIATHGFFLQGDDSGSNAQTVIRGIKSINQNENPLLRSGLALAGANQSRNSSDDGILTALEASGLNLWGTKLVVLSACDTGLGSVSNGDGVYGLRRSFVLAGTESLVMSLWEVSDFTTRELMTNYYKNLKQGLGRGEALRQVQLATLKQNGRHHPFYWASFIQSGEWANLDGKR